MKILPPTTHPSKQPFIRQHHPPLTDCDKGYHTFVPCLRWEFGFTCAFCLLHEGDLTEFGIKMTVGQLSVEHRELQKDDADRLDKQANLYSNCLYACMLCNRARSTKPIHGENNAILLDPTIEAWANHFEARDDQLIPKTPSAEYTSSVYRLNDRRKVLWRETRRKRVGEGVDVLRHGPAEVVEFTEGAQRLALSNDPVVRAESEKLRRAAELQLKRICEWRKALDRYQCIPADAQAALKCRCNRAELRIPAELERQAVDI